MDETRTVGNKIVFSDHESNLSREIAFIFRLLFLWHSSGKFGKSETKPYFMDETSVIGKVC